MNSHPLTPAPPLGLANKEQQHLAHIKTEAHLIGVNMIKCHPRSKSPHRTLIQKVQ